MELESAMVEEKPPQDSTQMQVSVSSPQENAKKDVRWRHCIIKRRHQATTSKSKRSQRWIYFDQLHRPAQFASLGKRIDEDEEKNYDEEG